LLSRYDSTESRRLKRNFSCYAGIRMKGLLRYVHILYFGVKEVTIVNSVVIALTTLSISKSM
jgi:hypothetical protein